MCDITSCQKETEEEKPKQMQQNTPQANFNNNQYNQNNINSQNINNNQNSENNESGSGVQHFNALDGYLPDGTPKHVDLGNRRLLDRAKSAEMDSNNLADIDKVFDSEVPNARISNNGLEVPSNYASNMRFKQKIDDKSIINVISGLEGGLNDLKKDSELKVETAKKILLADYEVYKKLMKDEQLLNEMNENKVDYRPIKKEVKPVEKKKNNDDFDISDKPENNDETQLTDLASDFGM